MARIAHENATASTPLWNAVMMHGPSVRIELVKRADAKFDLFLNCTLSSRQKSR